MEIGRNYLLLQIFPEGSLDEGVEEVVSQCILQMVPGFQEQAGRWPEWPKARRC